MRRRMGWQGLTATGLLLLSAGCRAPQLPSLPLGQLPSSARALQADENPEPYPGTMPEPTIQVPPRPLRRAPEPTQGNRLQAFVSPAETLPALTALIAGAHHSLYLETFNFGLEGYGRRLVPLLVAKARAGVEVKVVMDYCGSRFLPGHRELVQQLQAGGVEVRRYLPRTIRKDDRQVGINIDHRKLYLADGQRALVGGVNLMKSFDTIHQDILVRFEGPVVSDLYAEFALNYRAAGGKAKLSLPGVIPGSGAATAQVVVTSPAEGRFEARDAILAGLAAARQRIDIENQYLWDDRVIAALHQALARGVRLRVMVPGEEHKRIFKNIHTEELKRLVDRGAEARVYHGEPAEAHLHVKYYQVDDDWVAVGSTNADTRAMMDNQELQVVVQDGALVADLRQRLFERDWTIHSRPFVYQPPNLFTRPFRSLLELIDYYL
ncbi:MAG: phosphatidylserine/phosphatidylglycerophosphate/cardiolipin synthase family protein [Candidatus Sericytochromatia bacterium]|nr:phosphatidylserine/phosphatidylglycerophosphate/cardiolipin synthase family protein [Candidatus Sericytochromatia bacterium]